MYFFKFGVHQFIQVTRNHISAGLLMHGAMQIIISHLHQDWVEKPVWRENGMLFVESDAQTEQQNKSSLENISVVKMSTWEVK